MQTGVRYTLISTQEILTWCNMTKPDKLVIDLYTRKGKDWAQARSNERALYEREWLERFLALLPKCGNILDLGCGCGTPIASYFIERGHQLTGVDASPDLIEMAQAAFPSQTWLLSDMRSVLLSGRFDGILAWDSFFHLNHENQRAMFDKFAEFAAPGAGLMFTSGPSHGEAIGEFEGEPLYHASLDPSEYQNLLNSAGFREVMHKFEDPDCSGRTVWLAQKV
jgi:2-polyprenyl-3-methyl-5-hydroxy-6-metoxy-1,4-benzoquinol methylase